jgi:acetylornithine deacetylase/succinyl-diaminopimelate desuccinylase-like protein
MERTGIRPTFDVCGIWGGYTGEGAKTVLPSKAYAKISCRLVPNQDHHKIADLFKNHFEGIAPKSVKVNVESLHGGQGYVCPIDIPAYKAAEKAYTDIYGKRPVPVRSGGSIPIISTFEEILGIKSVLMGFGLESDAIHSPNENYPLEQFYNGIKTIPLFYKYYSEMSK